MSLKNTGVTQYCHVYPASTNHYAHDLYNLLENCSYAALRCRNHVIRSGVMLA